jgi:hypothetical protein
MRLLAFLLLWPLLASAELYQCDDQNHNIYQSWPCDVFLVRDYTVRAQPGTPPAPVVITHVEPPPVQVAAQPVNDISEMALWRDHQRAMAESMQNPIIERIRSWFK